MTVEEYGSQNDMFLDGHAEEDTAALANKLKDAR